MALLGMEMMFHERNFFQKDKNTIQNIVDVWKDEAPKGANSVKAARKLFKSSTSSPETGTLSGPNLIDTKSI